MSIAKRAVSGAAWTIGSGLVTRAIGLVGTLLITRYVFPEEYGEVTAAVIVVGTFHALASLGIGNYVLSNPRAGREVTFHATLLHFVLGVVALAACALLARWIGPFFDAPTMHHYAVGLAAATLIERIGFMPERILVRQLRFGVVSVARTAGELGYTVLSLGLAIAGMGAMAIVWGNLLRASLKTLVFLAVAPRAEWLTPSRPRVATFKQVASFGVGVTVGGLLGFASRRWSNLMIARLFGVETLGTFNMAYNLADVPSSQVGEQVVDVLMASFPHLPPERRAPALLRSARLLALVMFPLAVGLGAVAAPLAALFFHGRWEGVGPMLVILSIVLSPRPMAQAVSAYFYARGRPGVVSWIEAVNVALLLGLIWALSPLGILWACAGVGVAFTVRTALGYALVARLERIPVAPFFLAMAPPAIASALMAGAIFALRWLVTGGLRPGLAVALEIACGAIVYAGASLVVARRASLDFLDLAHGFLRRGDAER